MEVQYDSAWLDSMRMEEDELADKVIEDLYPAKRELLQKHLDELENNQSLNELNTGSSLDVLVQDILRNSKLPEEVMEEGRRFFDQNASDIMLLLGFLSLPYCYAAANGAEVLVRSKRILENPAGRLAETAQFVFEVFHKDAFDEKGKGLITILKVRLMHAATRWYVKQGEWNVEELGQPVNQEDMAGTNLSFSLMVVRGLRRLGKLIMAKDALSYIQYWNYIGRMLGLNESFLPADNKAAHLLEKRIRQRHFKSSAAGKKLAGALLSYYQDAASGTPLEGKVKQMLEFLLGEKISKMLGIETNDIESTLFKPYTVIMKLQNQLLKKNDSYASAWLNYQEQTKEVKVKKAYQLP